MSNSRKNMFSLMLALCVLLTTVSGCAKNGNKGNNNTKTEFGFDFIVEVEEGRDVKVLQISDTEIIDATQARTSDRLNTTMQTMWDPANMEVKCFQYIKDAVDRVKPDFIIFTDSTSSSN